MIYKSGFTSITAKTNNLYKKTSLGRQQNVNGDPQALQNKGKTAPYS